ncbi:MAG: ATP-binding cassette domain-containing protein, partial [Bacteroidales bacterium]
RNVSYMFQDYALFPSMTVEENIMYAQKHKNINEVADLMEEFGLTELKKRKPVFLSGGQKQRVALARLLARKPQILLLDEPLSALDSTMRAKLQDTISKAHQLAGVTTIMVSHDLNEVFRLATQVHVIKKGIITKTGTPEEVFNDSSISGKVQITGQIADIEKQDIVYIVTVITGGNQIMKVVAMEQDLVDLNIGDSVLLYTKAFNPILCKIK